MAAATPEEMAAWPAPNFDDPKSCGAVLIALTAPTLALVLVFTTIVSLKYGLGLHIWDQKAEWAMPYGKMAFVADILFPISCSLTKISLCLTYLRLFPSKVDRIFCYVISTFVTLYTATCVFLMLFQCTPIRGYWDASAKQHCINIRATLVVIAALNSVSDFLVYLWPAKPLWSLQLPLKRRLGLIFIFAVGCIVCVTNILSRMYYLEVYFESYDNLWNATAIYTAMTCEMNLGVICGCLSGVKPVLGVIFPRFFSSSYKADSRPTAYGQPGRTTHAESFPFQPLSGVSNTSKTRDHKMEHVVSIEDIQAENKNQRNFAWASSSGDIDYTVPEGAIGVEQVVTVHEGQLTPKGGAGKGDAGSEEWIMEDLPGPTKR
ncbi:hypothetical protein K505DRAFT_304089 [Melanomma pulvis-pyrius CBS 109.77]|uniref:Rhodopsin domain-containing protein n=1 Tax=Melanomma pulvis-pyrius CBS 109.77 TaxID=1314802 RepID=A0A6A6XE68_9PLEO|nr:hypothetical protein K505DRAFT_304089 [Melanomma pulvis-pyrius CBS 109.77]